MRLIGANNTAILEHLHEIANEWVRRVVWNVLALKVAECGGAIAETEHYQALFS